MKKCSVCDSTEKVCRFKENNEIEFINVEEEQENE